MATDLQKTSLFGDTASSEVVQKEKKVYFLNSEEIITKSLDLGEYDVLVVQGEVTIKCPCPIIAPKELTIKGKPGSKLTLINTEECQPCIGGKAYTGMSFGRWSPCYVYTPETLIVKGVDLICESVVENFTIGSYNHNKTTEIKCYNGSIECPEAHGERKLVEAAEPPHGSTKISMYPTYVIVKPGETYVKPYTQKQLYVIEEMKLAGISTDRITTNMKDTDLRSILKYAKLGMDVTPVYDNYEYIKGHVGVYLGALYVGVDKDNQNFKIQMMTLDSLGFIAEANIDTMKRAAVCKKICDIDELPEVEEGNQEEFLKDYVDSRIKLKTLSPQELQTWWELIPSIKYSNHGSVLEDVLYYYEVQN